MDAYDFNIWSNADNKLILTAYQQKRDGNDDGYISLNTSKYHSIEFTFPQDTKEIEFLLGGLAINYLPLTDYDDWADHADIMTPETPAKIADWVNALPEYEMEIEYV